MKKITVVTGASSGMGEWFALFLAKECRSDEIWIIARRADRLQALREKIEKENPKSETAVRCMEMDLGGKAGAFAFKKALEDAGEVFIDVLVNNAGFGTYGEFSATDTEREMDMIELNCTSLTGITGYAIPYMGRGSRIINVASLAAYGPLGNFAVYGATKAYVLNFTTAIRAELAPRGIRVTALCPGSVSTEFANVASKGARKEVLHGKSAEKTVRHALAKSRRGAPVAMWALKWKINAFLCTVMPSTLIAWATYKFGKRPSN